MTKMEGFDNTIAWCTLWSESYAAQERQALLAAAGAVAINGMICFAF